MAVATPTDVSNRLGRPLTPKELGQVTAYLEDAEAEIKRLGFKNLANPDWKPLIVKVECAVVKRAARLVDALNQVIPGDEQTSFANIPQVTGAVYLRREERRSLGLPLTGSARTTPVSPTEVQTREAWDWGPGWNGDCDEFEFQEWPY